MSPRILFAVSFFLLVTVSFPAHGQEWRVVESGVTTTLKDVMFVNKQTGWAGGDDSTLIKTTDGGATWFRQYPSVGGHVEAIWFLDEQRGYLIGGGITKGTGIYRTSDGGDTWEQYPDYGDFQDIQFVTQDTGWVIGYNYKRIWKTTDGGDTWNEKGTGLLGVFTSCSFINGMEGWVAGAHNYHDNFDEEVIWHTTDGGETWEFQDVPNRSGPLNKIHVLQSGIGFAYGWGEGIRTTNRGETWEIAGPGNQVTALYALDEQHVYLSRNDGSGTTIKLSSDTGKTWSNMLVQAPQFMRGIYMLDVYFGCAVGAAGKIWMFDSTTVGIQDVMPAPEAHIISHVFPNPVNGDGPNAIISITLLGEGFPVELSLQIAGISGNSIPIQFQIARTGPEVHFRFSPSNFQSGTYIYRIVDRSAKKILSSGLFHIIQ